MAAKRDTVILGSFFVDNSPDYRENFFPVIHISYTYTHSGYNEKK